MESVLNVARVLVMTQLRMWIMMYVRVVVEHIPWNFVVPHLVSMIAKWCSVKILEYADMRPPIGILNDSQRDIRDFASIAGHIEES
jgi:hypothetical protein